MKGAAGLNSSRKIADGVAHKSGALRQSCDWATLNHNAIGVLQVITSMMWRMLQQDEPDNYVVGRARPILCASSVRSRLVISGWTHNDYVVQDEKFYRPAEVDLLIADPSKSCSVLGWEPAFNFGDLVTMMVDRISN
jgi:GDPmannose 4,6-dehydratase